MNFPKDFIWGTATSAHQIEGSANIDGKVSSVWDTYAEEGHIRNNDNALIACDHYHKYKEDVRLLKELGVKAYRFSICWPRIITDINGTVNEAGLQFYSDLVDELLANGIKPFVTLFHWDHPQYLEDAFEGWCDRKMIEHFAYYTEVVVKKLGDRVKDWMTLNEPYNSSVGAYLTGETAPGKKKSPKAVINAIHNLLLSHGMAVKKIREFGGEGARVGIVLNTVVLIPAVDDDFHKELVDKVWDMDNGWWTNPLYFGKYPEGTWRGYQDATPDIEEGDMEIISQKTDFYGFNAYYSYKVVPDYYGFYGYIYYIEDAHRISNAMMPKSPETFSYGIKYLMDRFPIDEIIITENGNAWVTDTKEEQLEDDYRIDFMETHLKGVNKALDAGYNVTGYFYWSFMDNFEWGSGYLWKFGLLHIDENLKRIPKKSYNWYKNLIKEQTK